MTSPKAFLRSALLAIDELNGEVYHALQLPGEGGNLVFPAVVFFSVGNEDTRSFEGSAAVSQVFRVEFRTRLESGQDQQEVLASIMLRNLIAGERLRSLSGPEDEEPDRDLKVYRQVWTVEIVSC